MNFFEWLKRKSEPTPIEQRIYDGNRAKEVLENEAFIAVFADTKNEVIKKWTETPARDTEGREKCFDYLVMLQKIEAHLTTSLQTGKLAELDLIRLNKIAAKKKEQDSFSNYE
jgi:hypothetical protein